MEDVLVFKYDGALDNLVLCLLSLLRGRLLVVDAAQTASYHTRANATTENLAGIDLGAVDIPAFLFIASVVIWVGWFRSTDDACWRPATVADAAWLL